MRQHYVSAETKELSYTGCMAACSQIQCNSQLAIVVAVLFAECDIFNGQGGVGGGLAPTPDQQQCVLQQSQVRSEEVFSRCSGVNLNDVRILCTFLCVNCHLLQPVAICGNGPCFEVLSQIYNFCGYTKFNAGK
jgi:hypothetical protein